MQTLSVHDNNIQPTDIEIFSKFVNLKYLQIGTWSEHNKGEHNKFYGSFKSWKNLTKLESICIQTTDINQPFMYVKDIIVHNKRQFSIYTQIFNMLMVNLGVSI